MWLLRSQVLSPAEVEAEAVLPPAAATAAAPEEEGLLPEAAREGVRQTPRQGLRAASAAG